MATPEPTVAPWPESVLADVAPLPGDEEEVGERPRRAPIRPRLPGEDPSLVPTDLRWSPDAVDLWRTQRVTSTLTPVAWNYFTRFHRLTERSVGGTRPNAAFNAVYNDADTHWRLMEATGSGLPMDEAREEQWLSAAESASILGFDQLLTETLERAPGLGAVRSAADFVFSPSVEVSADRRGRLKLNHQTGGQVARKARQAVSDLQPSLAHPTPKVGVGLGWRLPEPDAARARDEVQWGAWMDVENVGFSNLRGEVAVNDLSWSVTARRQIVPDFALIGSVRSVELGPDPARWTVGAQLLPDPTGRWNLRLERGEAFRSGEITWSLTVRAEMGAWMPGRLDSARFGMPDAPSYAPNTLGGWGATAD